MASFNAIPPKAIDRRPRCPKCDARMLLARIFPDNPGYDRRTYECPHCEYEVTELVKFKSGR